MQDFILSSPFRDFWGKRLQRGAWQGSPGAQVSILGEAHVVGEWGGGLGWGAVGGKRIKGLGEVDVGVWKAAGSQPNWSGELFLERTRQESLDYSAANVCH